MLALVRTCYREAMPSMQLHNVSHEARELPWVPYVVICGSSLLLGLLAFLLRAAWRDLLLLVVTMCTVCLWAWEHWRARQRIVRLAEQIGRGKLEVDGDPALATLYQALNGLMQQRRVSQTRRSVDQQMITALAISVPSMQDDPARARQRVEQLANYLQSIVQRYGATVQMQGSDLFVLLFGLDHPTVPATSSAEAVRAARQIYAALPHVRFGLSYGLGSRWLSPWGEQVLAPALEDARRLVRLAQAWSEYTLLCPEPLAHLLSQTNEFACTTLELTNPASLPLRIYSLNLPRTTTPTAIFDTRCPIVHS